MREEKDHKSFIGRIISIQPRVKVLRSKDESRKHDMIGYILFMKDLHEGGKDFVLGRKEFTVGITLRDMESHGFMPGDIVAGKAWVKADEMAEVADLYRAGYMMRFADPKAVSKEGVPYDAPVLSSLAYDQLGCRVLDPKTWETKCQKCIFGAKAVVAVDLQWGSKNRLIRHETFCYGPLVCPLYERGEAPQIPNLDGKVYLDTGKLDEISMKDRPKDWAWPEFHPEGGCGEKKS